MGNNAFQAFLVSATVLISFFIQCECIRHDFRDVNSYAAREERRLQKEMETNSILESKEDYYDFEESASAEKPAIIQEVGSNKEYKPIVYWHGMGILNFACVHLLFMK